MGGWVVGHFTHCTASCLARSGPRSRLCGEGRERVWSGKASSVRARSLGLPISLAGRSPWSSPNQARPRATRSAQSRTTRMWLNQLVTSTRCQPAASSQESAGRLILLTPALPLQYLPPQDKMVCTKCQKTLSKSSAPDPFVSVVSHNPLSHALTDRSPLAVPCLIVSCAQRNRNSAGFLVSSGSGATKKPQAGPALAGPSSSGRQVGQNKLLSKSNRYSPMASKCKLCKGNVSLEKATYCQGMCCPPLDVAVAILFTRLMLTTTVGCAYKKGLCAICGKQILDTTKYKQSSA